MPSTIDSTNPIIVSGTVYLFIILLYINVSKCTLFSFVEVCATQKY